MWRGVPCRSHSIKHFADDQVDVEITWFQHSSAQSETRIKLNNNTSTKLREK